MKKPEDEIKYLSPDDENYPCKLKEFLKDHQGIYYQGDLCLTNQNIIAVVGGRKCTPYGREISGEIGRAAARHDVVIISGMAMGIDAEAQRTVLEEGGTTIGVLGCGIDLVYPKQNRALFDQVRAKGLLISEYPPGTKPRNYHFPMRNRIISALADAVIVVEAKTRSGSLITAECGVEQGKAVYGVPGNINSIYSLGTNKLIREGARPLTLIEDVFNDLGLCVAREKENLILGDEEKLVYEAVASKGIIGVQDLCEKVEMSPGKINSLISILEIKGLIYSEMGKVMIANFV